MGQDLLAHYPVARRTFEEVDEALGYSLSRLIAEGPTERLMLTEFTQPAIMATSIAVLRCLEQERGPCAAWASGVAGHSLGEYSALVAAGSLTLARAAWLLRLRGESMQRAVPSGEGAMAAILGAELSEVDAWIAGVPLEAGVVALANDNAPGQVVISGHAAAVGCVRERASEAGKRAIALAVSAPFHSPLMLPAARTMADALAETSLERPSIPVLTNVTASWQREPAMLSDGLVDQVAGRVRWRESMEEAARGGFRVALECGPGKVLVGLLRRIAPSMEGHAVGDVASLTMWLSGSKETA
jgi:[acyl-carrier-protein] S-malonyltransferase